MGSQIEQAAADLEAKRREEERRRKEEEERLKALPHDCYSRWANNEYIIQEDWSTCTWYVSDAEKERTCKDMAAWHVN